MRASSGHMFCGHWSEQTTPRGVAGSGLAKNAQPKSAAVDALLVCGVHSDADGPSHPEAHAGLQPSHVV